TAVTDRCPRSIDAGAQRGFRNDAPVPKRGEQIILAHDALALLNQINQEIEDLRLKGNQVCPATQLTSVRVNRAFIEVIEQLTVTGQEAAGIRRIPQQKIVMKKREDRKNKIRRS